jgi:hypothetical protein
VQAIKYYPILLFGKVDSRWSDGPVHAELDTLLYSNHFRQEFGRQIPSDLAMGFSQGGAGNHCIAHRRHEQFGGVSVCCMEYLKMVSTTAADNRINKLGVRELD